MVAEGWWTRWYPLAIGVIGGLVYAPTLRFGFVNRDDPWLIRDNELLHEPSLEALARVWFDVSWEERFRLGAEYLPVRDMSVMLDYALFGDWIGGHHLAQVAYYVIACALVVRFIMRWTGKPGLAAGVGLVFALHPLHVEAVAWLSERKGVLGAMFLFGALCALIRFLANGRIGWWVTTLLLFAFAVWSKAHMIAGVAMMPLLAWQRSPSLMDRRRSTGVVLLTVGGALSFVPAYLTGLRVGMVQPYHDGGFVGTLALFTNIHARYLKLMADIGPFAIHYPVGEPNLAVSLFGGAAALAMTVYVAWSVLTRKRNDLYAFGFAWWIAFLAPVSHLVFPIQNLMADRYMLVPSFGLILVACAALLRLRRPAGAVAIGAFALLSAVLTSQQTQTWQSSEAMWRHAVEVDPTYGAGWERLANEAMDTGDLERAWELTLTGLNAAPDYWRLVHRKALILRARGDSTAAEKAFRQAAANPDADLAQANLALLLLKDGRITEARTYAEAAVKTRGNVAHNVRVLGKVALQQGDLRAAGAAFERVLELEPYHAGNHYNMGLAELRRGRVEAGVKHLMRAREIDPALSTDVDTVLRAVEKREGEQ